MSNRPRPPDPLDRLEERLSQIEKQVADFQGAAAAKLSRAMQVLLQNEDRQDVKVAATLRGLERQMAEIRERLSFLLGPTTLH